MIEFWVQLHFVSNEANQYRCTVKSGVHLITRISLLIGGDEVSLKELSTDVSEMILHGSSQ